MLVALHCNKGLLFTFLKMALWLNLETGVCLAISTYLGRPPLSDLTAVLLVS